VSAAVESLQTEIVAIVGASRVVTDPAACAALGVDGTTPQCVVYPPSAEAVAALLRCAAERDLAVIACRNATKLAVGNPPRRYDVALSLKEMNRVWHYEPADLTVTAEPGMKFGDFQHFVGRDGLWLPLDPPGGARASLGGIVATNACGPLRLSFGAPRDIVLGMKIATVEGKVLKTGGRVVKNVTGYDIGKLLVGSYGTLGLIVEASFKLFPLPPARATFVMSTGTLGIARDLRRRILQSPLTPLRMVLLDAAAATLARQGAALAADSHEPELWIEFGGSERVLARCARELEQQGKAAGIAVRRVDTEASDIVWGRITDLHSWAALDAKAVILKVTLPDAASEEWVSLAQQEADGEKAKLAAFAQLGVGIVHGCLLNEIAVPALVGLVNRLRDRARTLGGALIVERCPAELKEQLDVWGTPQDDLGIMRKLKATWDPKGTLAPGRFLGRL